VEEEQCVASITCLFLNTGLLFARPPPHNTHQMYIVVVVFGLNIKIFNATTVVYWDPKYSLWQRIKNTFLQRQDQILGRRQTIISRNRQTKLPFKFSSRMWRRPSASRPAVANYHRPRFTYLGEPLQ
jgi:hypothetical protein